VWLAQNEQLLNADKSDVMFIGTSAQPCAENNVASVVVAVSYSPGSKPTVDKVELSAYVWAGWIFPIQDSDLSSTNC